MSITNTADGDQQQHGHSISPIQLILLGGAIFIALCGLIYSIIYSVSYWSPQPGAGDSTASSQVHMLLVIGNVAAGIGFIVTTWAAISWDPAQPERERTVWSRLVTGIGGVVLAIVLQHIVVQMYDTSDQHEAGNKPGVIPFDTLQK